MAKVIIENGTSEANTLAINRQLEKIRSSRNRTVTEGYWRFLFAIILTVWVILCYHAIYYPKIKPYNVTTTAKNASEGIPFDYQKNLFLRVYFIFATCNFDLIFDRYDKFEKPSIDVLINLFLCSLLLWYPISFIRNNIREYLDVFVQVYIILIFVTIYRRIEVIFSREFNIDELEYSHEKIFFWMIPEVIFIIVWYAIKARHCKNEYWKWYFDIKRSFHSHFDWLIGFFMMVPLFFETVIYKYTVYVLNELSEWNCALFYLIAGGSIYIGLTMMYFWLLFTAYIFQKSMDGEKSSYLSALTKIIRFHFGTACYHATLIFPRIKTFFIADEAEFDKYNGYYFVSRLCVTQCELHNLTLISTVIYGTSHSESLRDLFRQFPCIAYRWPNVGHLQSFSPIVRALASLWIPTISIMLILLWILGLHNSYLSLATRIFSLRLIFALYISSKVYETISDTILLHISRNPTTEDELFLYLLEFR